MSSLRSDSGQASVELVAILPLVGLVLVLVWQGVVAGGAIWMGGGAARAAARAHAVGADPLRAARGVLPARYERGLRVTHAKDGTVAVSVRIPLVVGSGSLATVTTRARFEAQR